MEVGLTLEALGHLLERRVYGDVRVRHQEHGASGAIVRLDDARKRRRLARTRRAPNVRGVAAERTAHGDYLVGIERRAVQDRRGGLGVSAPCR
jgi:hypothetical protein